MSRKEFEALIQGTWEIKSGDRYRQNGEFQTSVQNQWKIIKMREMAMRAKTWNELAKMLKLGA